MREMPCGEHEARFAAQGVVFVFNTQDAVVAVHPQVVDVFAPMDAARTWNDIPPPTAPVDPHASPHLDIYQGIFGVRMENALAKHFDG